MLTKLWFKKAVTYAPLAGGLLGVVGSPYVPWWVSVSVVLVMLVILRISSWRKQGVRTRLRSCAPSVELTIIGMVLAGYYGVHLLFWWLAHGSFGVAAGGFPIMAAAVIVACWNYPKALASLA